VLVEQGQEVRAGQPLIRFESYDLPARRTTAAAGVARAQAELDRAVNGFRPEEIAQARAQAEAAWMALELARSGPRKQEIDAARADRDAARADYELAVAERERVEALFKSGVVSRQDLDSARSTHDRAKARLEAAGQKLDLLEAGTRTEEIERTERLFREAAARRELVERGARKEDIRAARAQVERAQAELQTIEAQLAEIEVRSPSDAFVEVMRVRPGDLIAPNAAIATLVEVDRLWVRVFVPSTELGHVQLGKEAAVTVDSFRDETFSGRVEHISSRGEFTPRNVQTYEERQHQVFAVRLRLDNAARRLRPGMAADVRITR
jgi:multidrug resistance efflux pump